MDITHSRGLHLNPISPPIPTPSSSHKSPAHSPKRKPVSAWEDQVDECKHNNKVKKQRLAQIMNWPTSKSNAPQPKGSKPYEHKDGDKRGSSVLVAIGEGTKEGNVNMEDEGNVSTADTQDFTIPDAMVHPCDTHSCDCDSHSTLSSDTMSCDTLSSCDSSNFGDTHDGEGQNKKKKKKSKKRGKYSAAEEGKKVFVGGIKFEECDAMLSNQNELLASLRHQKVSQMFYLFGAVNRVQGHWDKGYCFVVFTTRKAASRAVKCLSFAAVRRRVVENLRDNSAPNGVFPLPSFYARWATTTPTPTPSSSPRSSSPLSSSPFPSSSPISISPLSVSPFPSSSSLSSLSSTPTEMEWLNGIKEENMGEREVERLMQELLKLRD